VIMDTYDRLIEILLTAMDKALNAITLGLWNRWQGGKRIHIYK